MKDKYQVKKKAYNKLKPLFFIPFWKRLNYKESEVSVLKSKNWNIKIC